MRTDIPWSDGTYLLDERFHLRRTESTVHAHGENRIRRQTSKESLHGLSAEGSASQVAHSETDHDWQVLAVLTHGGQGSIDTCLGIERVEDGLHHDGIHATLYETVYLLTIISKKFIVCNFTCSRIAHVWAHRTSLVGRTYRTYHKTRFVLGRIFVGLDTCQASTLVSHLPGSLLQVIVGLRNTLRGEGVGGNQVCSRLQVSAIDIRDDFRTSEVEHIVVTLHLSRRILETLATEILFRQVILLNLRTHGTVENQNPLLHNLSYGLAHLKY